MIIHYSQYMEKKNMFQTTHQISTPHMFQASCHVPISPILLPLVFPKLIRPPFPQRSKVYKSLQVQGTWKEPSLPPDWWAFAPGPTSAGSAEFAKKHIRGKAVVGKESVVFKIRQKTYVMIIFYGNHRNYEPSWWHLNGAFGPYLVPMIAWHSS